MDVLRLIFGVFFHNRLFSGLETCSICKLFCGSLMFFSGLDCICLPVKFCVYIWFVVFNNLEEKFLKVWVVWLLFEVHSVNCFNEFKELRRVMIVTQLFRGHTVLGFWYLFEYSELVCFVVQTFQVVKVSVFHEDHHVCQGNKIVTPAQCLEVHCIFTAEGNGSNKLFWHFELNMLFIDIQVLSAKTEVDESHLGQRCMRAFGISYENVV